MNPAARFTDRVRRKRRYERHRRKAIVEFERSALLNWMEFANAGLLHRGHRHLIATAIRGLPSDDPVVEIGAFCGLSTNVITYFLRYYERPNALFSIDPWVFEGEDGPNLHESDIPFAAYRELIVDQYVRLSLIHI